MIALLTVCEGFRKQKGGFLVVVLMAHTLKAKYFNDVILKTAFSRNNCDKNRRIEVISNEAWLAMCSRGQDKTIDI